MIISGAGGGGGKGGGASQPQQYVPRQDSESLFSDSYIKTLHILGVGKIKGLANGFQSVYFNKTPLQNPDGSFNFEGVAVALRDGAQDQSHIPGFENAAAGPYPVGVVVTQSTPITRTVTDTTANAVRLIITVPRLEQYTDKNDILATSVNYRVAVQYNGGGYTTVVDDVISGLTRQGYQRQIQIAITGAFPVDIRVSRVTADSSSVKLFNQLLWSSYSPITYAKLAYPGFAHAGIRLGAEQFSSPPTCSFDVYGLEVKIPSNATVDQNNGRLIYSGVWDGTFGAAQWTTDPAWCLWDLLTQPYGFGDHIDASQLDKWAFFAASQYCAQLVPDGFGGWEPRFAVNMVIDQPADAYKLIQDFCSIMRAMPYLSESAMTIAQDRPADVSFRLNTSNVSPEGFKYSGNRLRKRPTVAVVKYFNNGIQDYDLEPVEDREAIIKYGVVRAETEAIGCTSRGQAARWGQWLLYTEQREGELMGATAGLAIGSIARPGQVIGIADPVRSGSRRGGRIAAATTTAITADSTAGLTATNNSPTLSVQLDDGTAETRPVISIAGNVFTVSPGFSSAPMPNGIWQFETTAIREQLWRVLGVSETNDVDYEISAMAHDPSKYNFIEYGWALEPRDITDLNVRPAAPENLSCTEVLYELTGRVTAKILISWASVDGASSYRVRWRLAGGNWHTQTAAAPAAEIMDAEPGEYEIIVQSVIGLLAGDDAAPLLFMAYGRTAPPANVAAFAAVLDPSVGVTLNWDPVADLDLLGYEIWEGPGWGAGALLGVFKATSKQLSLPSAGLTTWWIKALDTSGNYSADAISASISVVGAPPPSTSGTFGGETFTLAWSSVSGSLATAYYEVRSGTVASTWATAASVGTVMGTTYATPAAWVGIRRFFVAAVDLNGTVGASNYFDALVIAPTQPTVTAQVIDNNVLLYWDDCTQTLPIASYELRKGASWATAQVIGTKQGEFTTVLETVSGIYTYFLAGIDVAGNYGNPGSITASVSQPPDYVLRLDYNSTFGGTKTNVVLDDGGALLACVDTTETWQSHFTSRGWTTLQDQVNAGFIYFAMPSPATAQYAEEIDYGTVLASSKISTTLTSASIAGAVTPTPTLAYRKLVTDAWTTFAGLSSVFATNFRYVRIQWDFASVGGNGLRQVTCLNVKLDSKLKNDSGVGTANAADSGGTAVAFNVPFIDIDSISVTPLATSPVVAVYDFVDTPNPTSFKVLLFNGSGVRISGTFSWSVRGV